MDVTMHSLHLDLHEHGLADGCPRCAEHAEHPVESLDAQNFNLLVGRTVLWMRDEEFPRSENEKAAMRVIESHLVFCRRMGWRDDAGSYTPQGFAADGGPDYDDREPTDEETTRRGSYVMDSRGENHWSL